MARISRRLALSLPAVLAAPVAAQAAAPHPDAELLALCGRYMSLHRRQNVLLDALLAAERAGNRPQVNALFEAQRRFVPYGHGLLAEIMDSPAATAAGLRAKAGVAMTHVDLNLDGTPLGDDAPLWSLCQDIMKGAAA